jgi:hypothetical protein
MSLTITLWSLSARILVISLIDELSKEIGLKSAGEIG